MYRARFSMASSLRTLLNVTNDLVRSLKVCISISMHLFHHLRSVYCMFFNYN
jgi:hypothetical protein